jgi:hypothetical protein
VQGHGRTGKNFTRAALYSPHAFPDPALMLRLRLLLLHLIASGAG